MVDEVTEQDIEETTVAEEPEGLPDQLPGSEEIDVEIMREGEEEPLLEEQGQDFFGNLAEDMDETILGRLASGLIADYRKDRDSRSDWEKGYIS